MKKINLVVAALMLGTMAFANGPIETTSGTSTVAVTNVAGSSVFKLYYKALNSGRVKVSILDATQSAVYSETITKTDGFARPYNFSSLSEGEYTIVVEDASGKMEEKIKIDKTKSEKLVNVIKVAGEDSKYLLTVASKKSDAISVKIFDNEGKLLLDQGYDVKNEFAKLFNLRNIKSFTIQVSDDDGIVKSISY